MLHATYPLYVNDICYKRSFNVLSRITSGHEVFFMAEINTFTQNL